MIGRAGVASGLVMMALTLGPLPLSARQSDADARAALEVAQAALREVTRESWVGLTDLMQEGAVIGSIPPGGGAARLRTREQERTASPSGDFVERGFDATVHVAGPIATVWLPYDFYRDGAWSHCGVDVFTMAKSADGWRIVSLIYTVEQPPVCTPHPDGPPTG